MPRRIPKPKHSILSLAAAERLCDAAQTSTGGQAETAFTPRGVPYTAGFRLCYRGVHWKNSDDRWVPTFTGGAVVTLRSEKKWDHLVPFRIQGEKRLKREWDVDTVSRAITRLHRELDREIRLADRREAVYHACDALPRSRQRSLDAEMEAAGHKTWFAAMDDAALDWIEPRLGLSPAGGYLPLPVD